MRHAQIIELRAICNKLKAGELRGMIAIFAEITGVINNLVAQEAYALAQVTQLINEWISTCFNSNIAELDEAKQLFEARYSNLIASLANRFETAISPYDKSLETELGNAWFDILIDEEDKTVDIAVAFELSSEQFETLNQARTALTQYLDICCCFNLIDESYTLAKNIHAFIQSIAQPHQNLNLVLAAGDQLFIQITNSYGLIIANKISLGSRVFLNSIYLAYWELYQAKIETPKKQLLLAVFANIRLHVANHEEFDTKLRLLLNSNSDQRRDCFIQLARCFCSAQALSTENFSRIDAPQNELDAQASLLFALFASSGSARSFLDPNFAALQTQNQVREWLSEPEHLLLLNQFIQTLVRSQNRNHVAALGVVIGEAQDFNPRLCGVTALMFFKPSIYGQNAASDRFCELIAGNLPLQNFLWGQCRALNGEEVRAWLIQQTQITEPAVIEEAGSCTSSVPRPFF